MHLREGIGFPSVCRELVPYQRPVAWRDPNGFYRLLGLTPAASDKEIRRVGRKLLAQHHPDGPEPDEEQFLCISEAYRVLVEDRDTYDALPEGYVMVTEDTKASDCLELVRSTRYSGWSYFSEVPRVGDDALATRAYECYLEHALRLPTTLPRISVALIEGSGNPWIEDGLIYVPVSDIRGTVGATLSGGPSDKAYTSHVNSSPE